MQKTLRTTTLFGKAAFCFLALTLSLVGLLAVAQPTQAQTATPPSPRDAFILAIQQRAGRDVDLKKPMETAGDLNLLFGQDAVSVGVSPSEVVQIYEDAYKAATPPEPWWAPLIPNVDWRVAVIFTVLGIIGTLIRENLTKFFKWIGEGAYNRLAGFRLFWRIALGRYRRALVKKHEELKIPFRQGHPLKMREVYVPLKVAGTGDNELLDARQTIAKYKSLVVVGAPGSGKSMLLRNLALTYAQGELVDFPSQPIPILLELNRLNASTTSLTDHLVEILKQNDFPNADAFVKAGLDHGLLLLLFDGLDEVNHDARESVVNKLKDLLREHSQCRAVVTCRTAVYHDEFADWAEQKLEIVDFSDQQIQRFLASWEQDMEQDMPTGKSAEHLLRNLHERPRIMALARNPLLLTIVAYLYTDTEFVLPHSRTEFYDRAVMVLLDQLKEKRNLYKAAHKRLVLQHLALFNLDSAQRGLDRRSIELPTILAEIKQVLPSLALEDKDAQPILDEIVARSGLMIAIDGGVRYQFAHLTLQEFFTALELKADAAGLIKRFQADREGWRETVKLWCGLDHNSTSLIRAIYGNDPLMAFECLGEAQQVDADFSGEVTNAFKGRLGEDGDVRGATVRAFAVVAAGPRPRGQQVFDFLVSAFAVAKGGDFKQHLAAANALALTNLPAAAEVLAQYAHRQAEVRPLLVQMGDLAVPTLAKRANEGHLWAIEALREVGTPQAALALVPLLWDDENTKPYQAAWQLAALLRRPNVESALRLVNLTPEQSKAAQLDWVWAPFNEPPDSVLSVIAGRIAYLLHTAPPKTIPSGSPSALDQRLVIPLCVVAAQHSQQLTDLDLDARNRLRKNASQFDSLLSRESPFHISLQQKPLNAFVAANAAAFVAEHVNQISTHPIWRYLFSALPTRVQFILTHRLIENEPTPTQDDWRNLFHPVRYTFDTSWQARGIKLLLILLGFLDLWALIADARKKPQLWGWENGLALLVGILIVVFLGSVMRKKLLLPAAQVALVVYLLGAGPAIGFIMGILSGNWPLNIAVVVIFIGGIGGIMLVASLKSPTIFLASLGEPVDVADLAGSSHGFIGGFVGGIIGSVVGILVGNNDNANGGDIGANIGLVIGLCIGGIVGVMMGSVASGLVSKSDSISAGRTVNRFIIGGSIFSGGVIGGVIGGGISNAFGASGVVGSVIGYVILGLVGSLVGSIVSTGIDIFSLRKARFGGSTRDIVARQVVVGSSLGFLSIITIAILIAIDSLFMYPVSKLLYDTWNWLNVVLFWSVCLTIYILLVWHGSFQERRAQNPLYGLLEEPSLAIPQTHSIFQFIFKFPQFLLQHEGFEKRK